MTTPVAPVGLTYDSADLQPGGAMRLHLEIVHGLWESPDVRGEDTLVPGLAGSVAGTRVNGMLRIELRGFVRGDPTLSTEQDIREDYEVIAAATRALFSPARSRADLVATLPSGATKTISARPLPGIVWDEVVPAEFANLSIVLEGSGDWS